MILSVHAITDLATRLLFHFFNDKFNFSNKNLFLFGIVGFAMLRLFVGSLTSYHAFIYISIFMGFFRAFINVHYFLVVSEYCSKHFPHKLSSALSLNMIINAIFLMTFGQLLGLSRMINESYVFSFHFENFLIFVVLIAWIFTE